MKSLVFASLVAMLAVVGPAQAGQGGGTQPLKSWDDMQTLEYDIGRIAGALDLCRRYSLSIELRSIANLSPYGKLGMSKMGAFDGIRGAACARIADDAKSLLADKDKLEGYLKAKYDCSAGDCVER